MDLRADPLRPSAVVVGWLAAALWLPAAVLLAVLGQGVGAVLGGCGWIGVSTGWTRTPWALVNQPTIDFAGSSAALGYWLGAVVAVLVTAAVAVPLVPRPRTLAAELTAIHACWGAAVVGGCWLPLLDRAEGHPARWLALNGLAPELVWAAPAAAAAASLPAVVHLLRLVRGARRHSGRTTRLAAVLVHLGVPVGGWIGLYRWLEGSIPAAPAVAAALPLLLAIVLAWARYAPPHGIPLEPIGTAAVLRLAGAAAVVAAVVVGAGRPLGDGAVAGVLWAAPDARNNIRPWIEPITLAEGFRGAAAGPDTGPGGGILAGRGADDGAGAGGTP